MAEVETLVERDDQRALRRYLRRLWWGVLLLHWRVQKAPASKPGRHRARGDDQYNGRAAAAAALLAVASSGVLLGAQGAKPGEPLWKITEVLFADRARAVELAAAVEPPNLWTSPAVWVIVVVAGLLLCLLTYRLVCRSAVPPATDSRPRA